MKRFTTVTSVLTDTGLHPVATIVATLALVLGVTAAVLALAVGAGAKRAERTPVQGLQPNEVVVSATSPSSSGVEVGLPSTSLTRDDVQALGEAGFVPDGVAAAPTAGLHTAVISVARSWTTDVIGSTPTLAQVRGYSIASGRELTPADVAATEPVAVVGETVVQRLFDGDNPIGQEMQINNHSFRVVGVFSQRGFSGALDQDDLVVIPITTAWSDLLGNNTVIDQVLIQAVSASRAAAVKSEATTTLLLRHGFTNPAQADFEVHTLKDLTAQEEQAATAAQHALELAAALLLLVAWVELAGPRGRMSESLGPVGPPLPLLGALTRAAIVTVVGIAVAAASANIVRHVIGGIPPLVFHLSLLVWGGVIGLVVAGVAWSTGAVRSEPSPPLSRSWRPGLRSRLGVFP